MSYTCGNQRGKESWFFSVVFQCYRSPVSGWRRWEGYKTRMKAELREVFILLVDSGRREVEGGAREAGRQAGKEQGVVFHGARAMELDERETEIADPSAFKA